MIRFRRGTSLLNKVVQQFDQAVADLTIAGEQIEAQRQATITKMEKVQDKYEAKLYDLRQKNFETQERLAENEYELYLAKARADAVRHNIAALVGSVPA